MVYKFPLVNRLEIYNQSLMSEIAIRQLSGNIPTTFTDDIVKFSEKEGNYCELTTKKILFNDGLKNYEDRSGYFCSS